MMKKICVFGTYKDLGAGQKGEIVRLGKLLAENGFTVVSGGFGGSMEDISKGAKSAGGKTIGVTYYKYEDTSKGANPYVDEEIKTGNIFERISKMMEISDGFIVLQGGTGTLLELAAVLEHINKGMTPPKPIVAIGDFWKGVAGNLMAEKILDKGARNITGADNCGELLIFSENVDDALKKILSRLGKG